MTETAREGVAWDLSHGPLRVTSDGRRLEHADGAPFLYLGDTNWELLHRATREEAKELIDIRAGQGFTVLFAPVTGILDCLLYKKPLRVPNAYGDLPFEDADVTRPAITAGDSPDVAEEYDYWDHIDYIIGSAKQRGMHVAVIPAWDNHYLDKIINSSNAERYGRFLGERLGRHTNLIWVLGGDTVPVGDEGLRAHRLLAAGIRATDPGDHLMSFHPRGGRSSSRWFQQDEWIDFHMIQSGHGARDLENDRIVDADYGLDPPRPTLDGECRYEDHAVNWNTINGWFNHYDARQAAYWSLFAGSFGHVYGTRGVWQMWTPDRDKYTWLNYGWRGASQLPGAWDMQHVRTLLLSRPMPGRTPDQTLLVDALRKEHHLRAIRGEGYAMVYSPTGADFSLNLSAGTLSGETLVGWWFDPRTGESHSAGKFANGQQHRISPPAISRRGTQRGNDWVLVLDDKSMGWPAPGVARAD